MAELPLKSKVSTDAMQIQATLSQKIRFKIGTVHEVGTIYEHLTREQVLCNDRTEIVPIAKY